MSQSKWMRAREEVRKRGDTQEAVTSHLAGGSSEAFFNNAMKPLITGWFSWGPSTSLTPACKGNMTGHEPSKGYLNGISNEKQMLDGPD